MKISNKNKDKMFLSFCLFIIFAIIFAIVFIVFVGVVKLFAEINSVNMEVINEYQSRPVVIRALTEADEANAEMLARRRL